MTIKNYDYLDNPAVQEIIAVLDEVIAFNNGEPKYFAREHEDWSQLLQIDSFVEGLEFALSIIDATRTWYRNDDEELVFCFQ